MINAIGLNQLTRHTQGRLLRAIFFFFSCLAVSSSGFADEFDPDKQEIYTGDLNGTGGNDIYIKGLPTFILIAGDISIPLNIPHPTPHILLEEGTNGSYTVKDTFTTAELTTLAGWTTQNYDLQLGDFNGDGIADAFLHANTAGDESFKLLAGVGSAAPTIDFVIDSATFGFDIAGETVTISDLDNDGLDDLTITHTGHADYVYYGNGTGGTSGGGTPSRVPDTPTAPTIASLPSPNNASDAVGSIAGSFRVDESGSATYNIPLTVAPGSGGVAPQLSVNYSSQGGNGVMGVGWSLGGLSSISRCRSTTETEGVTMAVKLATTDRFCLDGQKLIAVGSGTYGADGTEYRTEIDSQAIITSHGTTGTGPSYFKVVRKDGTTSEYGNSSDSKNIANGADTTSILNWLVSSIKDSSANGNEISFTYSNTGFGLGERLITDIDYSQGNHSIKFNYETRSDTSSGYMVGSSYESTQRLASVITKSNNAELRTYSFTYQNSAAHGLSQLTEVEECNGNICYDPTTFTWSDVGLGFETASSVGFTQDYYGAKPADINGDGLTDLVYFQGSGLPDMHALVSNGTTLVPRSDYLNDFQATQLESWHMLDYNNDGMQDMLWQSSGYWKVKIATTSKLLTSAAATVNTGILVSETGGSIQAVDLNGDGLTDLVYGGDYSGQIKVRYLQKVSGTNSYAFGAAQQLLVSGYSAQGGGNWQYFFHLSQSLPLDINGDGNVDYLAYISQQCFVDNECENDDDEYQWIVFTSDTSGAPKLQYLTSITSLSANHYNIGTEDFRVVDINADGFTDVLYRNSTLSWQIYISNGKQLTQMNSVNFSVEKVADTVQFFDHDKDGLADMVYHDGDDVMVIYNDQDHDYASAATSIATYSTNAVDKTQIMFLDLNGDGREDLVNLDFGPTATRSTRLAINPMAPTKLVSKITNGLGAETDITYHSLVDSSEPELYAKSTTAANTLNWGTSPVFDLEGSMFAVSKVASSAPIPTDLNAKSSVSYEYRGARIQSGGRGFLGFESVSSIDDQTNIKSTTTYRQDFPYTGMPVNTVVTLPGGAMLSEATNTPGLNTGSCGTGSTQRPYISQSIEKVYDLADASLMSTVTTNTSQDPCGNVLTLEVSTLDGANTVSPGVTHETLTTNTYYNNASFDLSEGRLKDATVVHTKIDGTTETETRKSAFEYNTTTGFLTKEIIEPDVPTLKLETSYTHDIYGNRLISTTAATGYTSRTSTLVYDADGQYVDQQLDTYGRAVETVISRNSFGQPTEVADINTNTMKIVYGALGRKYYEQNETGGETTTTFIDCTTTCTGQPSGTVYMTETTSAGGSVQRSYFDLLGREIRKSAKGFDGTYVNVDTEHDNLGRVERKSEPAYAGDTQYWTTISYDLLGRATGATLPDGSTTTTIYDGATDFSTVTTNGLAQNHTEFKNAVGQLIEVTDHLGGMLTYNYDPQGNMKSVTAPGNVTTTIIYDLRGRKTSMADPDKGSWTYTYTPFGELETQTDAMGQVSTIQYDDLGRMESRIDTAGGLTVGDAAWIYDVGTNGLGKLYQEDIKIDGATTADIVRTFGYDAFGRPAQVDTTIGSETFTQSTTYDEYGRVFQQFDASDYLAGQQFEYNLHGFPERTIEAGNSANEDHEYHKVISMDARGNITEEKIGGITSTRDYDDDTGRINGIVTNSGFLQDLSYSFDVVGNLLNRSDTTNSNNFSETFTYDGLNRLKTSSSAQATNLTLTYDAAGNIKTKSNMQSGATYNYGAGNAGPHAVTSVGSITYIYDANGNMTSGDGRTLYYTTFDKPDYISKGGHVTEFKYGPNRNRFMRTDTKNSQTTTTLYIGSVERITKPNGIIENKRYIGGKTIVTTTSLNSTPHELLVFTDHLGSTDALVNRDTGGVLNQGMSFDAFGLRRGNDWSDLTVTELVTFDRSNSSRGYTGHEQMDEVGLIHMNGRVYDPRLGRFLQADSVIDGVTNTQGYNRYSYLHNNPLNATDPTGFSAWTKFRDKVLRPVLAIVASIYIPGFAIFGGNAIIGGAVAGFVSGGIATGNLKGAVLGAFAGGVFGGIGAHFNDAGLSNIIDASGSGNFAGLHNFGGNLLTSSQVVAQISAHAIAGGVMSLLQGGKFGHGFLGAGLTKSTSNWQLKGNVATGVAKAAIVGGSVSALSGGKFGNGARTGAFQYLYNACSSAGCWEDIKSAFSYKLGPATGYGIKTKIGKAELHAGIAAAEGTEGNLSGDQNFFLEAEGGAALQVGDWAFGLSAKTYSKLNGDGNSKFEDTFVLGTKTNRMAISSWKLGVEVTPRFFKIGSEVDLSKLYSIAFD